MNKPLIAAFVLAATAGLLAGSARAADLGVPGPGVQAADECGPCGCVHVSYDYHRELRSTYGLAFDPRNFDQTQPYYYLGPVRAWPRFECDVAVRRRQGQSPAAGRSTAASRHEVISRSFKLTRAAVA